MIPTLCSYQSSRASTWSVDVVKDYVDVQLGPRARLCRFCGAFTPLFLDRECRAARALCDKCGYWMVIEMPDLGGWHSYRPTPCTVGVVRKYSISALDAPLHDLQRFLRTHPEHLAHVNPVAFEELIAACMRAAFRPCNIVRVGGTGDGGIDLLFVKPDAGHYLVQVKRRGNIERNEGVEVVRTLNGVLFREGVAKGMVVSTAKAFTRAAEKETQVRTGGLEYEMRLYGFSDIVSWLELDFTEPYQPWSRVNAGWRFSELIDEEPFSLSRRLS
jgi:hypothetical protein